jgi:uncharacterized 2Fe-2S/4Fe-4S cluster protein (DUF4445 family)
MILVAGEKLYAASCAAGPAFEGAQISCGSRAVQGAVQAVVAREGEIGLDVIGGGMPKSICGTGLIDAVTVMLELGYLEPGGRLVEPGHHCGRSRLVEINGEKAFSLAGGPQYDAPPVTITQKDIRSLQLAKAAIRTAADLLLTKTGVPAPALERLLLAGAFGNYVKGRNAVRIGLLPRVPAEKIHFVGNAAFRGAQMILLDHNKAAESARLARMIEYVEIANEKQFQDVFAASIAF